MRQTRISTYIDLLFCLVILPLIIMLVPVEKWIIHHTYFMLTLIVYLYALYFTYRKANIPSLFLRHKFGQVFFLIAALLIITWGLSQIPIPKDKFSTSSLDLGIRQHMRTQTVWFFFLIVTGFSLAIELTFELFRQILSKQEIEAEKNKAELALYKAQINPHFLFNTLNNIYSLIAISPERAQSAVLELSKLLRYVLYENTQPYVPMEKELEFNHNYIELMRLRLARHVQVDVNIPTGLCRGYKIAPLLFITLIENAFKHGTSASTRSFVKINMSEPSPGVIECDIENSSFPKNETDKSGSGIGLKNLSRQLELLYPGKYNLHAESDSHIYRSMLTIDLN